MLRNTQAACLALLLWCECPSTASLQSGGKSYAVVIGISRYEDVSGLEWLKYANRDAQLFEKYFRSSQAAADLYLLVDENATRARVLETLKAVLTMKAGPQDEVFIFISSRGYATSESRHGFLLAFESRRERPTSSAIKVDELSRYILQSSAKRVFVFADVCREPPELRQRNLINLRLEALADLPPVEAILASKPKQLSKENDDLGGGHGVFSYFLVRGLQERAADSNRDSTVSLRELFDYLEREVRRITDSKQVPVLFGALDLATPLPGLPRNRISRAAFGGRHEFLLASYDLKPAVLASQATLGSAAISVQAEGLREQFEKALRSGRLLGPGGATELFRSLEPSLSSEDRTQQLSRLATLLEERGQKVIVRYGVGDQFPNDPLKLQKRDFDQAVELFRAALELRPKEPAGDVEEQRRRALQWRMLFCRGRSLIFERKYKEAIEALDRAIRIEPESPEPQNALGIAYLESARYSEAVSAFQEAIRTAPDWAYARHNLALTYHESGNYNAAEHAYREALHRTPYHPYLYYNLGFLLHRLNRKSEAARQYLLALDEFQRQIQNYNLRGRLWSLEGKAAEAQRSFERVHVLTLNEAEVYNTLGALRHAEGNKRAAAQQYLEALKLNPALLSARHNLGVLYAEMAGGELDAAEYKLAIQLWNETITQDPGYLPSRLKLAEAYQQRGELAKAAGQYREILKLLPDYAAAQAALAETEGDLYYSRGQVFEACAQYKIATEKATGPVVRERLHRKFTSRCH